MQEVCRNIQEFLTAHGIPDWLVVFIISLCPVLENKTLKKRDKIDKYGIWGLLIFVAIPLPGTGGWTGALLASLLHLDKKKSFLVISLGVFIAGLIMTVLSLIIGAAVFN